MDVRGPTDERLSGAAAKGRRRDLKKVETMVEGYFSIRNSAL